MKTVIRLLVLVAVGWVGYSIFHSPPQSPPSDTVTVCQEMCWPLDYDFFECTHKGGELGPTNSLRFKINVADQTVFEDQLMGPYKFNSCKIMDLENWSCLYNDNSDEIGMGGGNYYEIYGEQDQNIANSRLVKATGQVPCSEISNMVWWHSLRSDSAPCSGDSRGRMLWLCPRGDALGSGLRVIGPPEAQISRSSIISLT
jgi:hypothetical protein